MSIQNITSNAGAIDVGMNRAAASERSVAPGPQGGSAAAVLEPLAAPRVSAVGSPTRDALMQAVDEVQKAIAPVAQNLRFSIDEDTGRTVVKVVDSATDEVIRQIPSEEVLAISKALDKLQGVLIQQKA